MQPRVIADFIVNIAAALAMNAQHPHLFGEIRVVGADQSAFAARAPLTVGAPARTTAQGDANLSEVLTLPVDTPPGYTASVGRAAIAAAGAEPIDDLAEVPARLGLT